MLRVLFVFFTFRDVDEVEMLVLWDVGEVWMDGWAREGRAQLVQLECADWRLDLLSLASIYPSR
jgi:hypothetical protein